MNTINHAAITARAQDDQDEGPLFILLYGVQFAGDLDDLDCAASGILRGLVYDPLGPWLAEDYATSIDSALKEPRRLSALVPGYAHNEEKTRAFLKRVAEQIWAGAKKPLFRIDDNATLPDSEQRYLSALLEPLADANVSLKDELALVNKIKNLGWVEQGIPGHLRAIRSAIVSDTALTKFAPAGWTEETIREYLKCIGQKLLNNRA